MKDFIYRLFFTRDDDMDVLQVLFTIIVLQTLYIVTKLAINYPSMSDAVRIESLVTLRWLTGLLVITAVPKWMVPFMTKHSKNMTVPVKQEPVVQQIDQATEEPSN